MNFPGIRIEGSIFSPDILDRLEDAQGQKPNDFGLDSSVKVKDEIARAWADAQDYRRIFKRKLETLKKDSSAVTETRTMWIAPLMGLFGWQLEFQARGQELNNKNYPISHKGTNRGNVAIHIAGYLDQAGLDRKPERAILRMSAHAMLQEYLNLSEQLYGIVTNGSLLRLLRDSSRLVKLTYLEFDLDRIFDDGLFSDFAILYRLMHISRFPKLEEDASACWLERYHLETIEQGTRIRNGLREAVTEALKLLGTGLLENKNNKDLLNQIISEELSPKNYFSYLLRLVYRVLFLMVIEERGLVFPKGTSSKNINIYYKYYSIQRLRRLSLVRGLKFERYQDAWLSLLSTFKIFETPMFAEQLGTCAFGGELFNPESLGPLVNATLSNSVIFNVLECLCNFNHPENNQRMPVNFGALATEEFGSVYESLLELHPLIELNPIPHFDFLQTAGNERKTSGSYYTPTSLVSCLLDTALNPVMENRIKNYSSLGYKSIDESVLALKVCDPACGSGHFLIAAAQRIARRLASIRAGEEEPGPELLRHTLREVIGHSIYGVDINPMSVELCKVGLWLEAVEPGKPLTFLDYQIRVGNSLLGTSPDLIKAGLPDEAFNAIEGDDPKVCLSIKKRNRQEREGYQDMFHLMAAEPKSGYNTIEEQTRALTEAPDETVENILEKEEGFKRIVVSPEYKHSQLVADSWCAAFVWKKISGKVPDPITTDTIRRLESNANALSSDQKTEVEHLSQKYQFFQWHLAFPEVFAKGGFDCVLGNPPWDVFQPEAEKFFAVLDPTVLEGKTASERKRRIEKLSTDQPTIWRKWTDYFDLILRSRLLLGMSGRFPLTSYGKTNLYSSFAEASLYLISSSGRVGIIVPTGIATDEPNKYFMQKLFNENNLISIFDFENKEIFPAVHSSFKFCLLTMTGPSLFMKNVAFAFFVHAVEQLKEPGRMFFLSSEDISLMNPNTKTCPVFRGERDAELTKAIYRQVPTFQVEGVEDGDPWTFHLARLFMMDSDSSSFVSADVGNEVEKFSRLYESKLIHQFDHRYATFKGVDPEGIRSGQALEVVDKLPSNLISSRFYVPKEKTELRYQRSGWGSKWALAFRDITNGTNERTTIACVIPREAAANNLPLILPLKSATEVACLCGDLNSFILDYISRQKVGGSHINLYLLQQFPILTPSFFGEKCEWSFNNSKRSSWLLSRILELTYTAWDLAPFAQDCGLTCPPYRWNDERRFLIRCEIDAAFFHFYLPAEKKGEWQLIVNETVDDLMRRKANFTTPRDAVSYIMDTFPIVRRRDEEKYNGDYRTKRVILEIYDSMQESIRSEKTYQTRLDPPPADPSCCHPPRK